MGTQSNASFPLRDETSFMAWPLPKGSLSFFSGHVVISHIAVSLNPKIMPNTLVKARAWKIQFEVHSVARVDVITSYVWCHMSFDGPAICSGREVLEEAGSSGWRVGLATSWKINKGCLIGRTGQPDHLHPSRRCEYVSSWYMNQKCRPFNSKSLLYGC